MRAGHKFLALGFAALFLNAAPLYAGPGTPAPPPCTPGIPCLSYSPDTGANNPKAIEARDETGYPDPLDPETKNKLTCDGDVMNQIHARAFLEAQRENMMNQIAIRKPDSILSYSCFDEFVGVAAKKIPPMFSEATLWSGMSVELSVLGWPPGPYPKTRTLQVNMGAEHIKPLMQGLALAPVTNFTLSNFEHKYLGDTAGFSYSVPGTVPMRDSMICSRMREVWQTAKCQNFEADPFMRFKELQEDKDKDPNLKDLASFDPRTLVGSCNNQKISDAYVNVAENKAPAYPEFKSDEKTPPYPFAKFDGIRHIDNENLDDYFDPKLGYYYYVSTDTDTTGCAPPVKTGVKFLVRGSLLEDGKLVPKVFTYDDGVCPNPHCYYQRVSGQAGGVCIAN